MRITVCPKPDQLARWKAEAARLGLTLQEWLEQAAELAWARGDTR